MHGLDKRGNKASLYEDVIIFCTDETTISMVGTTYYESSFECLGIFWREEMVTVFQAPKDCVLTITDEDDNIMFKSKARCLRLSPNLFGKGYVLSCAHGKRMDLSEEMWEKLGPGMGMTTH